MRFSWISCSGKAEPGREAGAARQLGDLLRLARQRETTSLACSSRWNPRPRGSCRRARADADDVDRSRAPGLARDRQAAFLEVLVGQQHDRPCAPVRPSKSERLLEHGADVRPAAQVVLGFGLTKSASAASCVRGRHRARAEGEQRRPSP
jgi:hypothetical protein